VQPFAIGQVLEFTPQLEAGFRQGRKCPVSGSWRVDVAYIKIKSRWKYFYRAVDKAGQTVDFLLTAHRDKKAAAPSRYRRSGDHNERLVARALAPPVSRIIPKGDARPWRCTLVPWVVSGK
jgi:hypothetical protein